MWCPAVDLRVKSSRRALRKTTVTRARYRYHALCVDSPWLSRQNTEGDSRKKLYYVRLICHLTYTRSSAFMLSNMVVRMVLADPCTCVSVEDTQSSKNRLFISFSLHKNSFSLNSNSLVVSCLVGLVAVPAPGHYRRWRPPLARLKVRLAVCFAPSLCCDEVAA